MTSIMISIISAIVAVLAAGIAFLQVRTMRSVSHGELFRDAMKVLLSNEMREMRAQLYQMSDKEFADWAESEYLLVERVCVRFSEIGFLLKNSYLPLRPFLEWSDETIARCYQIAEPLVTYRRERERQPSIFIYFEWIARQDHLQATQRSWWQKPAWVKFVERTADLSYSKRVLTSSRPAEARRYGDDPSPQGGGTEDANPHSLG